MKDFLEWWGWALFIIVILVALIWWWIAQLPPGKDASTGETRGIMQYVYQKDFDNGDRCYYTSSGGLSCKFR